MVEEMLGDGKGSDEKWRSLSCKGKLIFPPRNY